MMCASQPSMFGAIPLLEMIPSWSRCNSGPWGRHPMAGLLQEVLGNRGGYQGNWGWNHPGCLDHRRQRHCRKHCYGHCSPNTLLKQFIIEDIIGDTHLSHTGENTHGCKGKGSGTDESKVNESESKEKDSNSQVEVSIQTNSDDSVKHLPKPWSLMVEMNGCDEVRAWADDGKIVVEGHTKNNQGIKSVKRVMTLPHHIRVEALTATLGRDGILTIREAQSEKDNQLMDIPVQKQQDLQINNKEQNENVQDNLLDHETSEMNIKDTDILKEIEAVNENS